MRTSGVSDPTVGELLQVLGTSGLRLVVEPTKNHAPLTMPVLFDRWASSMGPSGGIVLGIGLRPTLPETKQAIIAAARSGMAAVVIKALSQGFDSEIAVARAQGIALIVADDDVDWRQLDALMSSALSGFAQKDGSLSALAMGDLFALANAIAAVVGGATTVEDMQERVLAYSTLPGQLIDDERREGILGRQVPEIPENAEQYAAVFRSTGAVYFPAAVGAEPGFSRLAIAVRAGTQPLGSIWVIDSGDNFGNDAIQVLEQSADIAALHMLRARSAADLDRQRRSELLRRLLAGGEEAHLIADRLGLGDKTGLIVLAFQPKDSTGTESLDVVRLFDLVVAQVDANAYGLDSVVVGDTVYVLFSSGTETAIGEAERFAGRVVERASAGLRIQVRAAVGSPADTPSQLHRSKHDADLILLLLATDTNLKAAAVASARDVGSRLTLLELAHIFKDVPRLVSPAARMMVESDQQHGTQYAITIRTYLDCSRDSAATASTLLLHQNTLRYRLRRAQELFGVDLSRPDDTLNLWLSLRVLEFD